jgi:hypothetical protein
MHWSNDCAHAPKCANCQKSGHVFEDCYLRKSKTVDTGNIYIDTFTTETGKSSFMKEEVNLNNIPVSFILDTGSSATIIGPATWEALGRPKLRKTSVQGRAYPQESFEFKGTFSPDVSQQGTLSSKMECYVAENEGSNNLMGLPWIKALGLLFPTSAVESNNVVLQPQRDNTRMVHRPYPANSATANIGSRYSSNKESAYSRNMSYTFNREHGVKPTFSYSIQKPVYVLNYRFNKAHWLSGRIVGTLGSRAYKVYVPLLSATVHRHVNQMCPCDEDSDEFGDHDNVVKPSHKPSASQATGRAHMVNEPHLRKVTRIRKSPAKFNQSF